MFRFLALLLLRLLPPDVLRRALTFEPAEWEQQRRYISLIVRVKFFGWYLPRLNTDYHHMTLVYNKPRWLAVEALPEPGEVILEPSRWWAPHKWTASSFLVRVKGLDRRLFDNMPHIAL